MPKVSIIIPTFNRANYILEAIDSALVQTHKDVEIIVVDDGSVDNTKEILDPYITGNAIQYLYQPKGGPSVARNTGLKSATGEYIKFLDSDDFLYPEQIEQQLADIKGEGREAISITDCTTLKPNGKTEVRKVYIVKKELQFASFIEGNKGMINAFLTPKYLIDQVGGFDESLNNCEDLDLWIRVLQAGGYLKHLPYTGCCCRISNTSHSSDLADMFLQKCKIYEKVNHSLLEEKMSSLYLTNALLTINTQLLEECMVRKMDADKLLLNTAKMTNRLYRENKKGIFKLLFTTLGLKNYLQLHYAAKRLFQKDYKSYLINHDYRWKNE